MIPVAFPLAQNRAHRAAIDAAIMRVIDSGSYILGSEVAEFERTFAAYCGASHGIGVASGTDALILSLRAFGIGAGDEVITTSHTALATVSAVLAVGATPVLVDIDPVTFTVNPAGVEAAITPRTRVIVAVHLYGQPADIDALSAIAKRYGVKLIEDCAQATGAQYKGRKVGGLADAGCFSFYPTKNLGAIGDGGGIVTNDALFAERARRIRQYGWNDARVTEEPGLNSRLDPLQAAILSAKLPHLDADNARRVAIARKYADGLAGLPIALPQARNESLHVYHLYVAVCDKRDALMKHLAAAGVGSAIHYPVPAHRQGGYSVRVVLSAGSLPETERAVTRIVSLPMYPELTDEEVARVIDGVHGFFR